MAFEHCSPKTPQRTAAIQTLRKHSECNNTAVFLSVLNMTKTIKAKPINSMTFFKPEVVPKVASKDKIGSHAPLCYQISLIGLCAFSATVFPDFLFNWSNRQALPSDCAPLRLPSREAVFPENLVMTAAV